MKSYLIRLDDACPFMDSRKWQRVETILDKYDIKPLVGIIPKNRDPKTMIMPEDDGFWEKARGWQSKGWTIALHGFDHVYVTKEGGINALWKRSEFAGLSLEVQKEKIEKGLEILKKEGLKPKCFFAPSHTFDENTLQALVETSDIRVVSDTYTSKPYKYDDQIMIVPCQMGSFRDIPLSGYWTACYHPNEMNEKDFVSLEAFIANHKKHFLSFDDIPLYQVKPLSFFDNLLQKSYFLMRRLRG